MPNGSTYPSCEASTVQPSELSWRLVLIDAGPFTSRGPSSAAPMPLSTAAIDVSASVTVECAAVARKALPHFVCSAPGVPQLTTIRCGPVQNSNERHPACALAEKEPSGGLPQSSTSSDLPAAMRWNPECGANAKG